MASPMSAPASCRRIVVATTNPHKLRELTALLAPLAVPLVGLSDVSNAVPPAPEDGASLAEIARAKASHYAQLLVEWVLSDDTGLLVNALGGAPGVRSARHAGDGASMAQNRAKLLADLQGVAGARRAARFECHLAIADPTGRIVAEATGVCAGRLRTEPAGAGGFGYDALFEVAGLGRTLAELDERETARFGHRGAAARRLIAVWSTLAPRAT